MRNRPRSHRQLASSPYRPQAQCRRPTSTLTFLQVSASLHRRLISRFKTCWTRIKVAQAKDQEGKQAKSWSIGWRCQCRSHGFGPCFARVRGLDAQIAIGQELQMHDVDTPPSALAHHTTTSISVASPRKLKASARKMKKQTR